MSPEFAAFRERYDRACQAGLVAAAEVFNGAVKAKLQRGYTSGRFATGAAAGSVVGPTGSDAGGEPSMPYQDGDGWAIRVGTNEMYLLYWEVGHINLFTRKYERVEHWRTTMEEEGPAMSIAFAGAYKGVMGDT